MGARGSSEVRRRCGALLAAFRLAGIAEVDGALLQLREATAVHPQRVGHHLPRIDELVGILDGRVLGDGRDVVALPVLPEVQLQPPLDHGLKLASPLAGSSAEPPPPMLAQVVRCGAVVHLAGAQLGRDAPADGVCALIGTGDQRR